MEIISKSLVTCPECGHAEKRSMPADCCQFFYECGGCGALLKAKEGTCCIFCSYGDVPCPPVQKENRSGSE
ncbi:MAG: GDCCVxC domain-containing (seleno)protein [Alphaproteobacteria bacterium]